MQKVLLLTTGGTIASQPSEGGLAPTLKAEALLQYLHPYAEQYEFHCENLFDMDSSNIQPEEWRIIARRVHAALDEYHAVIITHGTDTMAYTASALSFMLPGLEQSVVLTGSQLPMESPLSDGRTNLYTAVEAVAHGVQGVSVAFNRRIINGVRAVKVSTMGFDAFESVNAAYLGEIFADGTRVFANINGQRQKSHHSGRRVLRDELCTDVFLLKLLPGTRADIFDCILGMGYRGLVLEAFGAGGLHYINRDLLAKLHMLHNKGVAVVVCSQCLYERCDLNIYEVGRRILGSGVIPARDMTTEAATTKLMWALGQTEDMDEVRRMFDTNYVGEISVI